MRSVSKGASRLIRVLLLFAFAALLIPSLAHANADHVASGYEKYYRWYGVSSKTYAYPWNNGNKHVSSMYARARYGDHNYIEMGIEQVRYGGRVVFLAYENYPDTSYQRKYYYMQPAAYTWVSLEINNHTIGGSNWYARYNNTTVLHGLQLWQGYATRYSETQCWLDAPAERWNGTSDDNRCSTGWPQEEGPKRQLVLLVVSQSG